MPQNNSKIQGKFYPLQHEEWLRACWELKPAEVDVLYYLKTVKRIGKRISISCSVIASERIQLFVQANLAKLALAQATCSLVWHYGNF